MKLFLVRHTSLEDVYKRQELYRAQLHRRYAHQSAIEVAQPSC